MVGVSAIAANMHSGYFTTSHLAVTLVTPLPENGARREYVWHFHILEP
jgi:hypothetical protein